MEGARAPCTLCGAAELNKIGWSKAQQTTPYQCSHPIFYSLPRREPVQNVAHIGRDVGRRSSQQRSRERLCPITSLEKNPMQVIVSIFFTLLDQPPR